ncbi:hypothetical protein QOZ80_2BG0187830 [Eleusine coracana subsp. coracana]|nr:hypothetical protein QOZ80_2BG0187830 [Eleusine coracana subsp. coracana]
MTKLSNAARDLLIFMARTKLPLLAIGTAVVAKCRKLWGGLITHRGEGGACPADDYFRWSYEFSCTATPINALPVKLKRRRHRRLPPCIGGRQAREMMQVSVAPRDEDDEGRSPKPTERSPGPGVAVYGHEIDGLAEEFINWFHEQLRMQGVKMQSESTG